MVITAVGCQEGFATGAGAEEVGRSTTAAVVTSISLVVLVDLIFTALFYSHRNRRVIECGGLISKGGGWKRWAESAGDAETTRCISVENLRVSYGEREVLHGISFDVRRGEIMVILGGSGSGKSTLLRTLVGFEKPTGERCGSRV